MLRLSTTISTLDEFGVPGDAVWSPGISLTRPQGACVLSGLWPHTGTTVCHSSFGSTGRTKLNLNEDSRNFYPAQRKGKDSGWNVYSINCCSSVWQLGMFSQDWYVLRIERMLSSFQIKVQIKQTGSGRWVMFVLIEFNVVLLRCNTCSWHLAQI